jgi:hypothetical protein
MQGPAESVLGSTRERGLDAARCCKQSAAECLRTGCGTYEVSEYYLIVHSSLEVRLAAGTERRRFRTRGQRVPPLLLLDTGLAESQAPSSLACRTLNRSVHKHLGDSFARESSGLAKSNDLVRRGCCRLNISTTHTPKWCGPVHATALKHGQRQEI